MSRWTALEGLVTCCLSLSPQVDRAFLWENFIGNRGIDQMHEGTVRILSEVHALLFENSSLAWPNEAVFPAWPSG